MGAAEGQQAAWGVVKAPPYPPGWLGSRPQIVLEPGEVPVVGVAAERKVVGRHASTLRRMIVKHKRMFLYDRVAML